MSLNGKVVWLTGASSGIGEALVSELVLAGAKLAISARRAEKLEALAEKSKAAILCVPLDVTIKEDVQKAVTEIEEKLGPLDVVIANAGNYVPTEVDSFSSDEVDATMKLNYSGVIYCFEAAMRGMIERKSGYLVGVASVSGYRGLPRAASYAASKAALISFIESFRFDIQKYGVDMTVVNPGFVKTPLTDKNDFPMPFLVTSEQAAKIMVEGMKKRKKEIHFPWQFSYLLKFMRIIPFPVYHWLISKQVAR